MKNSTLAKKALSILLAVFFGACSSGALGYLAPSGMFLSALSVFSSVLMAFLFGFAGLLPAIVMAFTMLVSGFAVGGWIIPSYLFLIGILPAAVMIFGSIKGIKFFSQVRNALVAELIAFVILLASIKVLTGQDFASFFKSMFDQMMAALSPEAKAAFVEQMNMIINQQYASESAITAENMLEFFSEGMEQTLSLMMPVSVILYSVINGAAGVLWMNWLRFRHEEENVQFVPLRGWRLSKQVTLGLLIVFVAVLIIGNRMAEAGLSARIMVGTAIICAAFIQASASFLSRLSLMGVSTGKRTAFLVFLFPFAGVYFSIYGILSALFGSHGLFTPRVRIVRADMHPDFNAKNENKSDDQSKEEKQENEESDKEDN